MPFTGNENCTISIKDAADLNANFRNMFPGQPLGIYFSQRTLQEVLGQTACVGIRFYFAADADGQLTLTFAGVVADEDDILGIIGDGGLKCPPSCGTPNVLNS
jgi:hypothetical protein